jgi:type IV secretory pathway TraG/TraD family ATPase VirD4
LLQARDGGDRGHGSDPFWQDSAKMLLGSAIDLLGLANEPISFPGIQEILIGAPDSSEEVRSPDWQAKSYLNRLVNVSTSRTDLTASQRNDLGVAVEFWLNEYPRMDTKTRSGVVATVTSMTYAFRRGVLADLFGAGGEQLTPEASFAGNIVIIDLPVKEFLEVGQFAQVLWKLLWMRAAERRDRIKYPRPVVLWADEAQNLVTRYDSLFQATARSAGVATVYLTQNRDSLRSRFKGSSGDAEAEALLGNFNLKCFTCNDHTPTNEWAARMIGEEWQTWATVNTSLGNDNNLSAGTNEQRRFLVEPLAFMRLRKGGPENHGIVETIMFRSGRPFAASAGNHLTVHFRQDGTETKAEDKS